MKNKNRENYTETAENLCKKMESVFTEGYYPLVKVTRSWSIHNPVISGEFSHPAIYRWYLKREFTQLLKRDAVIDIEKSRKRVDLHDPEILKAVDEDLWDFTRKKLFLFSPERIDLSFDRLAHYTGTSPRDFQRYILFTNYDMHVDVFCKRFPDCKKPDSPKVQMPAYHHILEDNSGITLINIGVGPSNAKTCTDHIAVLRPDAMIMVGHCGGLRNQQEIGDFVLASSYMREDLVLDHIIPQEIPVISDHLLNRYLMDVLEEKELSYRSGTVYTTGNRNWEFHLERTRERFNLSRSIAIDMESATIAANGFRYRIPSATLLCVSDKPLHGKPKLKNSSRDFYEQSKSLHLDIVLNAIFTLREKYCAGLPNGNIRASDEPLMGSY